jgi:hypothetical protein
MKGIGGSLHQASRMLPNLRPLQFFQPALSGEVAEKIAMAFETVSAGVLLALSVYH